MNRQMMTTYAITKYNLNLRIDCNEFPIYRLSGSHLQLYAGVSHSSDKNSVGKSPNFLFLLAGFFNVFAFQEPKKKNQVLRRNVKLNYLLHLYISFENINELFAYKKIFFNNGNPAHFCRQNVGPTPPKTFYRKGPRDNVCWTLYLLLSAYNALSLRKFVLCSQLTLYE